MIILGTNDIGAHRKPSAVAADVNTTLVKMQARLVSGRASHILVVAPFNFEATKRENAFAIRESMYYAVNRFGATWIDPLWDPTD